MTVHGPRSDGPRRSQPSLPANPIHAAPLRGPTQQHGSGQAKRDAFASKDIEASRADHAKQASRNAHAVALLGSAVARAIAKEQAAFAGLFHNRPVTVELSGAGLKGCAPESLADRGALARFLKSLDTYLALSRPAAFARTLEAEVAKTSPGKTVLDFTLQRAARGYVVRAHLADAHAAESALLEVDALLSEREPAIEPTAALHQSTILQALGDEDRARAAVILTALGAANLAGDKSLADHCGLRVPELRALISGDPLPLEHDAQRIAAGLFRYVATRATERAAELLGRVSLPREVLSARAVELSGQPLVGGEIPPAFARALACLGDPALERDAMSIIRARVYSTELEDGNFHTAIGAKREVVRALIETPGTLARITPTALVLKLLDVNSRNVLPASWWSYTHLDREACAAVLDKWLDGQFEAVREPRAASSATTHTIDGARLLATFDASDALIAQAALSSLYAPGFGVDRWACPGVLGVTADELTTLLEGGRITTQQSPERFMARVLGYVGGREISDSQWRCVMPVSQARVAELAERYREQHRDAM